MAGGNLNSCGIKTPKGGAARRRGRSLFSNVHGRFRTRGRNSSATVRGTQFLVKDTCKGTLTQVTKGVVLVRDFTLRKNKVVKAGHKYLARARKKH
jgi:ferric-dicitrate binding protein FerR (iron transport regulator)